MSEAKPHILLVDDDVQFVAWVRSLLDDGSYQVSFAHQAEEGLALARENRPDLVLLDITFAGTADPKGPDVPRPLYQDAELAGVPMIILSGVKRVLDMPVAYGADPGQMPVRAFLQKPFEKEQLLAKVQDVLEKTA